MELYPFELKYSTFSALSKYGYPSSNSEFNSVIGKRSVTLPSASVITRNKSVCSSDLAYPATIMVSEPFWIAVTGLNSIDLSSSLCKNEGSFNSFTPSGTR